MNFYKNLLLSAAGFASVLFSGLAFAHAGHDVSVNFMSGLLHPFSGIDHLLVIVLVGFWSAFVLIKIWIGPSVFLLGMCVGVIAGLTNIPLNFFEFGVAASVIAIGFLLLVKNQYSSKAILTLIGTFGIFHGFAHAQLFSDSSHAISLVGEDIAGLILATAALHLSGVLLVKLLKEKTTVIAKITGFASVIYGWVLISQLSFALLGGVLV
jgi:urease accessory protein